MHVFSYSAEVLGLSRGTFEKSSETLKIININFFYAFIIQMVQMINTEKKSSYVYIDEFSCTRNRPILSRNM